MELGELLASSSRCLPPLSPGPRPRRPPFPSTCHHLPLLSVAPPFPRLPLRVGPADATRANGAAAAPPSSRWRVLCSVDARAGAAEEIGSFSPCLDGGELGGVGEGMEAPGVPVRELREDSLSIWGQMKEIVAFAAPATGLWVCAPLMSLIDTMVIGQGSSVELAALGPGTVFCDYLCYVFMFLSIATSNMVATSFAKKDRALVQHQISMLLFVAFICGLGMFLFTKFFSTQVLAAFIGPENVHILPAASSYVQIRGFAWPALLVGMVAQSASLGMKDSLGPLKALAVASAVNGFGDVLLCCVFSYGITGAAWATMVSQVIAAYMMIRTLNKTGFSASIASFPSPKELLQIFEIAAPVFITMTSKVAFYSLLTYVATSMGTVTGAAHQVMINVYCMCTVWGEPLSQTAQSFMPELIHGVNPSLAKARMLLRSLVIIGALTGLILGATGTSVPWLLPYIFTSDHMVIGEMHKVLLPYFIALLVTPSTHSLEGTLMAGRDLKFLSLSMLVCFCFGSLLLGLDPATYADLVRASFFSVQQEDHPLHAWVDSRAASATKLDPNNRTWAQGELDGVLLEPEFQDPPAPKRQKMSANSTLRGKGKGTCPSIADLETLMEDDGEETPKPSDNVQYQSSQDSSSKSGTPSEGSDDGGDVFTFGKGFGLHGCWWALSAFQWARFSLASQRLSSPRGMLYNEKFYQHELVKVLKAA